MEYKTTKLLNGNTIKLIKRRAYHGIQYMVKVDGINKPDDFYSHSKLSDAIDMFDRLVDEHKTALDMMGEVCHQNQK